MALIRIHGNDRTLKFAASELARYLKKATGKSLRRSHSDDKATFTIGLAADLGIKTPKLSSPPGDDWITIRPTATGYVLAGSNPRSVLFAVYRYLREMGIRWIRPGSRGEMIPRLRSPLKKGIRVSEAPSYRYRTICIEGACSFEHVRDLIDWMAKHGMNGYFIQFHYGMYFFRRWYEHRENKYLKPEPLDDRIVDTRVTQLVDEIQKRGMSFERMGHGWTCAALGISGEGGWDKNEQEPIPQDKVDWLAEVNEKRELWGGIALNTNLNYGNPAVRAAMTDAIVDYAGKHAEVNLLHFWLADGMNNHDERPESQAARPSDFFVDMLNELDRKLTAAGLTTRIVFLVYVDLLWPPERAKIEHQGRFVLMFAPITRSYLTSFMDAVETDEMPQPYVRNKLEMPKSPSVNLHYLRQWQEMFRGDGFDFDYHAIWACYYDPSMITISKVLHKDIQGLGSIGLHGLNSVQNQRMSFPHNLLMDVMAQTLWNKKRKFSDIVTESFNDAFGRDGAKIAAALTKIADYWKPFYEAVYIPAADEKRIAKGKANLPKIESVVADLRQLVRRNRVQTSGARLWSWKYLNHYLKLLDLLLPMLEAYLHGRSDTRQHLNKALDYLCRNEKTLHPVLDVYMFIVVWRWRANELEAYLKQKSDKQK
ncbi:MAG: hypothetical protein IT444_03795 [Phycisphaeraceae bacterium]|nr:hypothetical protein [Phycisphaeraceae bacterium]